MSSTNEPPLTKADLAIVCVTVQTVSDRDQCCVDTVLFIP